MRQLLLQNATVILLQSATEVFCKMCQVLGHLLQIVTILLQNATVITKCNVNYKLQELHTAATLFTSTFLNF